ncbi:MAG: hypothetical protein E6G03_10840 [Actinobacteria bacterium]|nr:MAG: hypothetical protein E6G03_10840 [Actinomycetota bacterium]
MSPWLHRQAHLDRPRAGLAVSCALAALVVCVLVGPAVLVHPASAAVGLNPASDFQVMTWSLEWWPWAVGHRVDLLHTHLLWPPEGFSTLWMTTIPVPALLAAPLTLTAGPLVAYNALILLSVVLATGAAYLLCRELTDRLAPSLAGGLLFGLSPYMLGHMLSQHLDLTFVFPVPLLALLVVRYVRGRTSGRRFVAGFASLLVVQLGSSFELFVDLTLLLAVGLTIALLGRRWRPPILRVSALVGLAYAFCLPILVPIGVLALSGQHAPLRYSPANFSIDLLNVAIPTPTLLAGRLAAARAVSQHFVSNVGEQNGYLGIPLLVVAVLAVRAEWRRGAWIAGGLLAAALLLSFGPTLTVEGRPLVSLPFAVSRLPVFRDALPARMSLFTALAAACLCSLWLARLQRHRLQLAVGVLVGLSLIPNFWPADRLPGAWSISDAFGWSTRHAPEGFVDDRAWTRVIPPGSTALVLPTGDRTAASYWQATTGMRFRLAVPATPFVPGRLAGAPTISGLVQDVMPRLAGHALAAARLRAFLLADRVAAVVVMPSGASRWRRIVARATGARSVGLGQARVYRVRPRLHPLRALGDVAVAHQPDPDPALAADRGTNSLVSAWLSFDGRRAHVLALLRNPHRRKSRAVVLSAPNGDSDATAAAVDDRGRVAVAFTEWRDGKQALRIATQGHGHWRVVTLDRQTGPIWSPHVVITPGGTTVVAWIDETDPSRTVRVAVLTPSGVLRGPVTLENGDGFGNVVLSAGRGDGAVAAWHVTVANEWRVRVARYQRGAWSSVATLSRSLYTLDHIAVAGRDGTLVRWLERDPRGEHLVRFEARPGRAGWIVARAARPGYGRALHLRARHA